MTYRARVRLMGPGVIPSEDGQADVRRGQREAGPRSAIVANPIWAAISELRFLLLPRLMPTWTEVRS